MTSELSNRREQFFRMKRHDRSVVAHTVMIGHLPLGLRDPNALRRHIETHMFPGYTSFSLHFSHRHCPVWFIPTLSLYNSSVVTVDICFHIPDLLELMAKIKEAEKQLLHYRNLWAKIQREKTVTDVPSPYLLRNDEQRFSTLAVICYRVTKLNVQQ
jgi:hypothetical protein